MGISLTNIEVKLKELQDWMYGRDYCEWGHEQLVEIRRLYKEEKRKYFSYGVEDWRARHTVAVVWAVVFLLSTIFYCIFFGGK